MWIKKTLILLTIFTYSILAYKYPYKHCCRWKPVHGPIGYSRHPPKYIHDYYNSQKVSPIYGAPPTIVPIYGAPQHIPKPIYGPPQFIQKPIPVYGPPQQSYINHQGFNNFQNHQNYQHQTFGYNQNLVEPQSQSVFAHHKVLSVAREESKLPQQLLNPFYKNPAIKEALAKHSWLGPGEKPELHRETDRISRQRIFDVLSHAGLIRRR